MGWDSNWILKIQFDETAKELLHAKFASRKKSKNNFFYAEISVFDSLCLVFVHFSSAFVMFLLPPVRFTHCHKNFSEKSIFRVKKRQIVDCMGTFRLFIPPSTAPAICFGKIFHFTAVFLSFHHFSFFKLKIFFKLKKIFFSNSKIFFKLKKIFV